MSHPAHISTLEDGGACTTVMYVTKRHRQTERDILMQAIDQIEPHMSCMVDVQRTLNDMFIDLQSRFSSATDPASQTRDTAVWSSAFIDISDAFQQGHVTSGAIDSVQPSSRSGTSAASEIRNGLDSLSFDS